ncbi:MAG: hypothetical protein KGQ93_03835 [Cyanobacteria bacterium REEB459]|nr:hypothetical protein [Cyanobacteria bacterium REEB459]
MASPFWRRAVGIRPTPTQPLDCLVWLVMAVLLVLLALLMLVGDHARVRVRDFTWQGRQVGVEDRAFVITFSRPMDTASVETNLTITPPLPGKISWAGRRLAYTLQQPIPYGQTFRVNLLQARDRFAPNKTGKGSRFQPFQAEFSSRKRAFLYIGVEGEEANRLVLADPAQRQRLILTPKNLRVLAFKAYPLGDRVLFSAGDSSQDQGALNQQLYRVTTGIQPRPPVDLDLRGKPFWQPGRPQPISGKLELVLDNRQYQNLKFDLSADGQVIVVQRVNRSNPADFGAWVVPAQAAPYRLNTQPGGDFLIAPDSQSLVLLQGTGTAIIDLARNTGSVAAKPLDFLPEYGQVLDITPDGTAAAMVNFNQNDPEKQFQQSLVLVTNQGQKTQLLQVRGGILGAHFDPMGPLLYVVISELETRPAQGTLDTAAYVQRPLLLTVNLKTLAQTRLLRLPPQPDVHMSLSPDGRFMLLNVSDQGDGLKSADPSAGSGSSIWTLDLRRDTTTDQVLATDPQPYPFKGLRATWLP